MLIKILIRLFSFVVIGTLWMLCGMFLYHIGIANPQPFIYMINYLTTLILVVISLAFALFTLVISMWKGQAKRRYTTNQTNHKKNDVFPTGYIVVKTDLANGKGEPVAWFVSAKNRSSWIEQQQKCTSNQLYQWHWSTDYNNAPPPTEKTTYFRYKDKQQALTP